MEQQQTEKKKVGRPKKYADAAARVAAFRARAKYPGHRVDAYLSEDAFAVLNRLKKKTDGGSVSEILNALLLGELRV